MNKEKNQSPNQGLNLRNIPNLTCTLNMNINFGLTKNWYVGKLWIEF